MRLTASSGLDFTEQSLRRNLDKPTEELSASFRGAYAHTLKPHHGLLVRPVFSAAMSATPYRADFYAKLGKDQVEVEQELRPWLDALRERVGVLNEFLKEAKW